MPMRTSTSSKIHFSALSDERDAPGDEIGQLSAAFNRMIERLRQNQKVRETFGRYVDPRIAERIHATARSRVGHEVVTPRGDIVTEELEDSDR